MVSGLWVYVLNGVTIASHYDGRGTALLVLWVWALCRGEQEVSTTRPRYALALYVLGVEVL